MGDSRYWIAKYLDEGFGRPHPVKRGEKVPREDWRDPNNTFALGDFGPEESVGTMHKGGLVAVDPDFCEEAILLCPHLLLETERVQSRLSEPLGSKYWFIAPGLDSRTFKDVSGEMLIEIVDSWYKRPVSRGRRQRLTEDSLSDPRSPSPTAAAEQIEDAQADIDEPPPLEEIIAVTGRRSRTPKRPSIGIGGG